MRTYTIIETPAEGGPPDAGAVFRARSHGAAWRILAARLRVDGPRSLTAVTAAGAEIRASLYDDEDHILASDGRTLRLP